MRALLIMVVAAACSGAPAATTATLPAGGSGDGSALATPDAAVATDYAISGTAETVTSSCGTPPYHAHVRAVDVYRDGTQGASMTGPPFRTIVATRGRFSARLPAGHYCLSTGGATPVCDAELELPGPPDSARTVSISHRNPMQETCAYDAPPPTIPAPCVGPAPGPDYVCIQNCGPPVVRQGDPPPGWSWHSPDDARKRQEYGCPRCLPPDTRIATPTGDRPISELAIGDRVITLDLGGARREAAIVYLGSTPAGAHHRMTRLTLADGRVVAGSPGHPDAAGRPLGGLHAGDAFDGSRVVTAEDLPFTGDRTWDLLPSGDTGLYVADGVVLRSTFFDPH